MHKILITNMTGARNRGCEALVSSIHYGLSQHFSKEQMAISLITKDAPFDRGVFTGKIEHFIDDSPRPNASRPIWRQKAYFDLVRHGKSFGLKRIGTFRNACAQALVSADLLIATGGDIFTSDYGDFATQARIFHSGTPVAVLAHTIGPFNKADEAVFRELSRNMAIVTVRESESFDYVKSIYPDIAVEQTADVAFLLQATQPEESRRILDVEHRFGTEGRRMVGLSVSEGIISFRKDVESDRYIREISAFIDSLNHDGFSVVLIPHVQERAAKNNDLYACRKVLSRCRTPKENVILALPLSASDYKGIAGLCEVLVGARTHATIASMSQGIPTVSIAYSRKAWGIMRDYYGKELGERLTIDVAKLDRDQMLAAFSAARANGRTPDVASEMRKKAALNFVRIHDYLEKR